MMSRQMNLPQIQKILQDFERESSQMDMKEEMMGESIDDAMEDEGETEEEEGSKILDEVLAEIGISVGQQVSSAGSGALAAETDAIRVRHCSSARRQHQHLLPASQRPEARWLSRRVRSAERGQPRVEEEAWARQRRATTSRHDWPTCGETRRSEGVYLSSLCPANVTVQPSFSGTCLPASYQRCCCRNLG